MDFKNTKGLKKDSDFRIVYKHGNSFANKHLVLYILKNKSEHSRIGISVSKKVGKAVTRNKLRRVIKESYRIDIDEKIKPGYDLVFIGRIASKNASSEEIKKSVSHLVRKADMFK